MTRKIKNGSRVMSPGGPGIVIGFDIAGRPKVRLDLTGRCETYAPKKLAPTAHFIPEYGTRAA
jgi:hypothetical protein